MKPSMVESADPLCAGLKLTIPNKLEEEFLKALSPVRKSYEKRQRRSFRFVND